MDERYAYQRVADILAGWVAEGTLSPGEQVPSVRRMSAQWNVSIPTVLQAYRLLEARQVLEARPRSGYFVRPRTATAPAQSTSAVVLRGPTHVTTGDLIVDFLEAVANPALTPLGTALPDPLLLPTESLARLLGRVARRDRVRSAMISSPSGAEELRSEIAHRSRLTHAAVTPDDVVVTSGCAEAISLALRALTKPGDAVAVESPSYFGTLQAIEALGLRALEIPTHPHEGIDVGALDMACRQQHVAALVVTPTVHNPLGSVMSEERRRYLIDVAESHALPVIEDETYAELRYGGREPTSLRAIGKRGDVLTCGSFSKTLASAYRVGWIIPGARRRDILRIKAATIVGTPTPTQLAIAEFLATGGYDNHVRKLRSAVQVNVQRVSSQVAKWFPAETTISAPAGGFLLWVQLPTGVDTIGLLHRCLARGVSIAPGPAFSASGAHRNCLRLNAGLLWSGSIEQGLTVIAEEADTQLR